MKYREDRRKFLSWRGLRSLLSILVGLLLVLAVLPGISWASAPDQPKNLSGLIQAARREGVINFAGPSTLGPNGAGALIAALNKKYGLHLKLHYVPSSSYPAITGQLVTEATAGQPLSYDVVYQTQDTIDPLLTRNLLQRVPWTAIFPHIGKKSVLLNGRTLLTDNQFTLPAYNTKLVPPREVPKSWDDFLNPRWKGKILIPVYTGFAMYWAQMWGEEKTLEYLKKLKGQDPIFGRYPEIETRLASGEYPLAIFELNPFVEQGQEAGAPLAFDNISPTFVELDMMGVMKKGRHRDAAELFAAFTRTAEGQAIWWKYAKRSSVSTKGSWAAKFARGKKLLFPDLHFFMAKEMTLRGKFARALGIR